MNEENIKLNRVKKSCKALTIVTRIFGIMGAVGFTLVFVAGIVIILMGTKFDDAMKQSMETGEAYAITTEGAVPMEQVDTEGKVDIVIGSVTPVYGNFDVKEFKVESDIPAVQNYADEHPYSLGFGTYCLGVSVIVFLFTVVMFLISGTFAIICKSETPFEKKVLKRVLISMIIVSVALAFTAGFGFALIGGLFTWAVYTILDYGRVLQEQVDETL